MTRLVFTVSQLICTEREIFKHSWHCNNTSRVKKKRLKTKVISLFLTKIETKNTIWLLYNVLMYL